MTENQFPGSFTSENTASPHTKTPNSPRFATQFSANAGRGGVRVFGAGSF